jgi:hypothetical protein
MYSTIDELIHKCGRQYITNLLPSLFIKINTSSAEDKTALFDLEYDDNSEWNSVLTTLNNQKVDCGSIYIKDHLNDIKNIVDILGHCKKELNIEKYDYIIFSYLGDYIVRYKNQNKVSRWRQQALYLDIQSVRIALIDENIRQTWQKYYLFFNNGFKFITGYVALRFIFGLFNYNIYSVKKLIGM